MHAFKERDNVLTFEPSVTTWEGYNAHLCKIS